MKVMAGSGHDQKTDNCSHESVKAIIKPIISLRDCPWAVCIVCGYINAGVIAARWAGITLCGMVIFS